MIDLDNLWYNELTRQLGLNRRIFQISRPSAPMAPLDSSLWDCQDAVPPASLIFDRSRDRFARFSSQYALILSSRRGETPFETVIGTENYRKWSEFLNRQMPPPDADRIPGLFMKWAIVHSPGAAATGASALAAGVLASAVAHRTRQPHSPALEPPREFEGSYGEMREMLSSSMTRSLAFDARQTGTDTGDTLAASASTGFPGLWNGATAESRLYRIFAGSRVTVEVAFGGYAVWASKPGRWCDAEVLRGAFRERQSFSWEAFFGPNGSLLRAITSLVVADGINATITSDAILSGQERAELESNACRGVWPFYAPESGFTTNCVTFGPSGETKIRTVTKRGHPATIGNNVVSIAQYLDGVVAGSAQASGARSLA
jgi:hypothetical protein